MVRGPPVSVNTAARMAASLMLRRLRLRTAADVTSTRATADEGARGAPNTICAVRTDCVLRAAGHVHRGGAPHPGRPRGVRAHRTADRCPTSSTAVERGEFDAGLVPIENMIEGSVSVTLDTLAFDSELWIQREIDLPVSLNLCAKPGVALADVKTVVSFPHAIAQCRGWIANKLPARRHACVALDGRSRVRGRQVEADGPGRDLQQARGGDVRARRARDRDRGPSREPDPLRARRARHPRADRSRQDDDRLLPARGQARARCSRSSRSSRRARSTSRSSSRARPSAASATTASSSTSRATSPTSWWPTGCATSPRSRPR